MIYTNNNISINFTPWFDNSYKLESLHIYEELGGTIANGTIRMSLLGNQESLDLLTTCYTGLLEINKGEGNIYKIDVFITNRSFLDNYVTLEFICLKKGSSFSTINIQIHSDITDTIKKLYPGNIDIRCETDIQDGNLKLYQNGISDIEFLNTLCKSYKKQSVFAFGWEGLLIKEVMGIDSTGKEEPSIGLTAQYQEQLDKFTENYNPSLYNLPYNPWEDSEQKHISKDFSENEPINIRATTRFETTNYVQTPYLNLYENLTYNNSYYNSNYFQNFRIVFHELPNYKIGDVLIYNRAGYSRPDNPTWPYKYYLVKSNEFFCSSDSSRLTDSRGLKFSFLTKLVGLEKDGSVALGKDITDDPTLKDKE